MAEEKEVVEKAEKTEKTEKVEKVEKAEKTEKVEKAKKAEKTEKKSAAKASPKKKEPVEEEASPVLRLHDLSPAPGAKKAKTRVGRGEGSKGKTAGRGTKGTKARYQVRAGFEGGQMPLHMRLPKLRGFKNPFRTEYQVVNVGDLDALFPKAGTVGVEDLVAAGAVRGNSLVKVLGDGELSGKFDLTVDAWSASAQKKVEAAGGKLTKREAESES